MPREACRSNNRRKATVERGTALSAWHGMGTGMVVCVEEFTQAGLTPKSPRRSHGWQLHYPLRHRSARRP